MRRNIVATTLVAVLVVSCFSLIACDDVQRALMFTAANIVASDAVRM